MVQFPQLGLFAKDFSNEKSKWNQQVVSRIPTIPGVSDFSTANGYVSTDATTTDIPVTIDKHKHVSLKFGTQELSATGRNLVQEQINGAAYALGKKLLQDLMELVTNGNFSNETVETAANSDRDTIRKLAKALNARGVPAAGRNMLVNADVADNLMADSRIVSRDYAGDAEGANNAFVHLRNIQGFENIIEWPDLHTDSGGSSNLLGFGSNRNALVIASRVPDDPILFAQENGLDVGNPGNIEVVTDTDTGLSMMYRYYADMQKGTIQMDLTWMYGVAVGVAGCLQRQVSGAST